MNSRRLMPDMGFPLRQAFRRIISLPHRGRQVPLAVLN